MLNMLKRVSLFLCLALTVFAQTPLPGSAPSQTYDLAYVASRPPQFAPFYYGTAYGDATKAPLSAADRQALIQQVSALFPVIEQIEGWGLDPFTIMAVASMQGNTCLPPGTGNVTVVDINQPLAVVPMGGYTGAVPAGWSPVITDPSKLIPWATLHPAPPAPAVNPVGPQEFPGSNEYGVVGTNPPATYPSPYSGMQFVLTKTASYSPMGPTLMVVYLLLPIPAAN